jgi:hypothetical protein
MRQGSTSTLRRYLLCILGGRCAPMAPEATAQDEPKVFKNLQVGGGSVQRGSTNTQLPIPLVGTPGLHSMDLVIGASVRQGSTSTPTSLPPMYPRRSVCSDGT